VHVENNMFTCSTDTQDLIAEKVREKGLNRVVIAACTPRTHEPLFQETLQGVGLNKYMIEMANIRNMNSWVHPAEPEKATQKAKVQVRMAVAKVAGNYPLDEIEVSVTTRALVIGAGMAGMNSAINLADQGYETILIEKGTTPGGVAADLNQTWKGEEIKTEVASLVSRVKNHDRIRFLTDTTLTSVSGSVGSFTGELTTGDTPETVEFGACILATGAQGYEPDEYLYREDPRVLTSLELDALVASDEAEAKSAGSTVFIQCVGSRDHQRPYCSRVCCAQSIKKAVLLKKLNPAMDIYILYRDIRTYADKEALYKEARDLGVLFIRYSLDRKPVVARNGDDLVVDTFDPIVQLPLQIQTDRVVLATAIVPNPTDSFVEMFKCGVNADGFLTEAHPKLKPVDSSVDGVFLAGMCHYPKPVDEAVAHGLAAASRAGVILSTKSLKLDGIKSHVTHNCDGCALCVDLCPYNAITLESYEEDGRTHKMIKTDKALCKGCGICAATCPKEGVVVNGFTPGQIRAQMDAILERP
ncbi:MAG: FAD-dependent oxidoreductase, partial [Desulfobacteraceae bacterium]